MYALDERTIQALEAYKKQVANLNGANSYSIPFDVKPSIEIKLIEAYQKSTEFLKKINMTPVKLAAGGKLGLGSDQTFASTTDTRIQPRRPTMVGDLEAIDDYLCTQTDFDVGYDWRVIDTWAEFADFQQRLANLVVKGIARDQQRIGFNGTHRAKTSNRELYPNLDDVNIGWLEKIRHYNPERTIADLKVGAAHEFKNMDALVEMAKNDLIGEQFRSNTDLVAITSTNLIQDKYSNLINQAHTPTEQIAANTLYSKKELGTLPTDTPAYFPQNSLLITSYDNLSIYVQKGSTRRFLRDEPEWNRTADYQSSNQCYVVEDYSKAVLFDNITLEI